MPIKTHLILWLSLSLGVCFILPAGAAYFGKNKLQTRDLDWHIFETEHFEIHYYPEEEALAREVCEYAEAAYQHDTRLLREKTTSKTPLFIYRNQIDFQQTNILPHIIGVGTGGFTEAFKNRVALPAPDSPEELRRVIFHEFVHVLQFNILYGEGMRSFRVYKGYLIPLWVLEGLAEYGAQHWDSYSDMVIRDAVLHDRLVPLTIMEGFTHLEDVYLAYKESELAIQYIADQYGEDKLSLIFKKFKTQISISQILRETIGLGLAEFNENFLAWVKQKYWAQAHGRDMAEKIAAPLDPVPPGRLSVTAGPAWSPDQRFLAYCSNRDQTMRVYLKTRNSASSARPLTNKKFEFFSMRGNPLAWSPDSRRIAFVAREEGKSHLYLLTVADQTLERHSLPVDDFFSPAWSPRGDTIALVGVRNGVGDLYLWNVTSREMTQLTRDRFADNAPAWSPDGQTLVYTTEREAYWQLAWLELAQDPWEPILLTNDRNYYRTPHFSPSGDTLYFSNDRNGIFNLFQWDLATSSMSQLTNLGIGAFQPALSPEGQKLAFTHYERGNQVIYLMPAESSRDAREIPFAEIASETVAEEAPLDIVGQAEAVGTTLASAAASTLTARAAIQLVDQPLILDNRPYQFRFGPDLLFLLAGYDSSQGIIGGGYLTASDYLGNHNVSLISDFVPGYRAQTQLTYANLTYPVDIFFSLAYSQNFYRILDLEDRTLTDEFNDEEIGGAVGLVKPFSLFDRVELEFGLRYLRRIWDQDDVQNRRVANLRFSMVHDSTDWWDYGPANGFRHNLTIIVADKILGGMENYTLLQLNTQAYKSLDFLSPHLVFGSRLTMAASVGPEHPVFLFGGIGLLPESATIRGYRYGELMGSQIGALNLELRFPLARHINYTLWPLDFLLIKNIQMVVYADLGLATSDFTTAQPEDFRNSVGIGFRLHTFLLGKELMIIRFDISQRTDRPASPVYVWGLGQAF